MTRDEQDKILSRMAKLDPEDRQVAQSQEYCPVREENRLGTRGVPEKVMIGGQVVFLCCSACTEKALADGPNTLAKVARLKTKATPSNFRK